MTRFQRLPGCICRFQRCFSTSGVAPEVRLASTGPTVSTDLQQEHPYDPYHAFVSVAAESSSKATTQAEGSLSSLTFSVKDNFATHDQHGSTTSCGSRMLQDYRSPFEATIVKKLRKHGARIVGKTNMDEFGMGSNGVYSIHGSVKNPLDPTRVAGGSSSGAAASVAAGYCDVAIGSDTGGSVRLPASYTGTLGFKPSYGLLSRYGLVAYASSLDTVGIFSRRAKNARRTFRVINEYDKNDPTAIPSKYRPQVPSKSKLQQLRIGIPVECFPAELTQASIQPLRQALARLRKQVQVELVSISIPSTTKALSAYYTIASAEASSNLARYDGIRFGTRSEAHIENTRTAGFGAEVQKRIILGTYALSADAFDNYFLAAQALREELKNEMDSVFMKKNPLRRSAVNEEDSHGLLTRDEAGVDILMFPSAMSAAPTFEEAQKPGNGTAAYVQDVLTVPASLAGLPAASCPVEMDDVNRLPIGVQVVGQWGDDELVLDVAELLEL